MHNRNLTVTNKQTDKGWVCAENLLSIDGSKTVSIPHKTYYDCSTSTGLTISLVVQPSTSFRIGKKDVGGWEITYSSGTVTFTVYNTSTSLSVAKSVMVDKLSKVTVYYTTIGKIGIYVGNSNSKVESSGTITGDCTNTNPIVISGISYSALLSIYNKQLSDFEADRLGEEVAIIPKSLHSSIQGYWPMQERTGAKAYDTIEQFNWAKGTTLTPNHGDLIGYTTTELGTDTNETTQTAKVDFYTKAVIDRTNGSGVDLVSGLPEMVNAVTVPTTTTINLPTSLPSPNANEWSIFWTFYVDSDSLTENGYNDYLMVAGSTAMVSRRGRVLIGLSTAGHFLDAYPAGASSNSVWKKGFHSVCIKKIGVKHMQIMIDGKLANTVEAQTGNINKPYLPVNDDILLSTIGTNIFNTAIYTWRVINYGIANYALSVSEFTSLHNNTFFKNPNSLNRWLCYYQFNSVATSYTDLTGNSSAATTSATVVSSTINSLR